jgi:hypothetical protein
MVIVVILRTSSFWLLSYPICYVIYIIMFVFVCIYFVLLWHIQKSYSNRPAGTTPPILSADYNLSN